MTKKIKEVKPHDAVYSIVSYEEGTSEIKETATIKEVKKDGNTKPKRKRKND